jgi:hypothetical protein
VQARVLGVWRDYARQFGAITIDDADYRRLTGDTRINDLALWLHPAPSPPAVQDALRALLPDPAMLDFASSAELRKLSLRIFDRSFAVTYYLQAVAIAIGLIGIAASLSAQVLARRKEFGLLAHLGLTRGQVIGVVAGEGAAWVAAGTLVGLAAGAGRQHGAGGRGQPAELSLDHGHGAALGPPGWPCVRRCCWPARPRPHSARAAPPGAGRAVGEGGLVNPRRRLLACSNWAISAAAPLWMLRPAAWGQARREPPRRPRAACSGAACWPSRATTARTWTRAPSGGTPPAGWPSAASGEPSHGFQVTFFRSRTGLAQGNPSRFAARTCCLRTPR